MPGLAALALYSPSLPCEGPLTVLLDLKPEPAALSAGGCSLYHPAHDCGPAGSTRESLFLISTFKPPCLPKNPQLWISCYQITPPIPLSPTVTHQHFSKIFSRCCPAAPSTSIPGKILSNLIIHLPVSWVPWPPFFLRLCLSSCKSLTVRSYSVRQIINNGNSMLLMSAILSHQANVVPWFCLVHLTSCHSALFSINSLGNYNHSLAEF
jgi:hypothetical protein